MKTACGICGRPCIPMADYDVPCCAACDARFEAIDLRASITGAVVEWTIFDLIRSGLPKGSKLRGAA